MSREEKKSRYEGLEATVGMAVMDTIPCVFFAVAAVALCLAVKQPLFIIGQILCTLAGFGKAIWKFIKAIKKENHEWLASQFKFTMSTGFLLCVLSLIIGHKALPFSLIAKNLFSFPVVIFVVLGMLMMTAMIVLGAKMDPSNARANWIEQTVNLIAQLTFMLAAIIIVYASTHYDAVHPYFPEAENGVVEKEVKGGLFFDGPGTKEALVFYPGGLVDYEAYVPLMREIAAGGVDCFLVEMPYYLAVFGINKADKYVNSKEYSYENWYVGGHSLGGAMAASYAGKHKDQVVGLLLCAAYSTAKLPDSMTVVSVYGSEDKVLQLDKYEKYHENLPGSLVEKVLKGGNHGQFGDYGDQKGDGQATISSKEQVSETSKAFLDAVLKEADK